MPKGCDVSALHAGLRPSGLIVAPLMPGVGDCVWPP